MQPGIVLPAVICALVLMELLAVGTIAIAYQELALSRQRVDGTRAQLAARTAAVRALREPSGYPQALAPGARATLLTQPEAHGRTDTELERLTESLFLLRIAAEWGEPQARSRAQFGLLLTGFDPVPVLTQFSAALNTGGDLQLLDDAQIDGSNADRTPAGWDAAVCRSWLPLPAHATGVAYGPGVDVQADSTVLADGAPLTLEKPELAVPGTFDRLGALDLATFSTSADRIESGIIEILPLAAGSSCDTAAAGNWGAPLDTGHPCSAYFPLIYAPADLSIRAGAGQGILVVDGDLSITGDVRFFGLVLVRGSALLEPGARIEGALLVRGGALPSLIRGASVRRGNCAIARALTGAVALNRLELRRGRAWIPLF